VVDANHADLETGGGVEMPDMQGGAIRATSAHDQADRDARYHALHLGVSGRREMRTANPISSIAHVPAKAR
jgi:hypothetical protein